jgi:GGDEF domain-containing protein
MLRRADRQLYAAKERGRDCTLAADGQAWALAA